MPIEYARYTSKSCSKGKPPKISQRKMSFHNLASSKSSCFNAGAPYGTSSEPNASWRPNQRFVLSKKKGLQWKIIPCVKAQDANTARRRCNHLANGWELNRKPTQVLGHASIQNTTWNVLDPCTNTNHRKLETSFQKLWTCTVIQVDVHSQNTDHAKLTCITSQ